MANKDDYLTEYRKFFEYFAKTVNPHDQLPVKLACYKLVNVEVVGGIIDWTTQYLTQKKCPENLIAPLIKIVIDEIRKACKKHPVAHGFNTSEEAYEPLKLMQCVMAKTNEVCLRYLDNSMLCSLPSPGPPYNVVSVHALKNVRRKMEDRHVVIHDLNTMFNIQKASPSSYYAIFDGHAGHDAAAYSSAHLHQFLAESKHFINNPAQALIDAFCKTDSLFIDKCRVEKLSSGTTAVCALLRPKEKTLYIAWAGDSQALLVNQGKVLQCVVPHKPSREDEKNRIEQQGGAVLHWGVWRVNGQLAVSRAIGDAEYKPYVTATPDVQEIPLSGGEDFLILACDGLWDYLSEDDAACAVYNMVCNNPDDTESISHHLVQLAKQQGSTDNISVIVVFLREPSKVAADAHWANRNRLTMEAGLDNANATNNPFANSNGTEILQQKEGFLLNLTEGFNKQNGAERSPSNDDYTFDRPANGKRRAEEFDEDEDMGPETDVDAIDDSLLSPVTDQSIIDNKNAASFDPFTTAMEEEKSSEVDDLNILKQQTSEFEPPMTPREEAPTPPANEVHDAGVEENVADSGEDSEDEWDYFKGDSAGSEKVSSSKADQEVAELTKTAEEDEEEMSQLNPNAAEFVPISSPTRNVSSPACRALINDEVIAQSPRRATPVDINLPNPQDFEKEVKSRPSDVISNGQDEDQKLSSQEVMENLLNGRNIEDIEFHPSTPQKTANTDEFHFGPNATPFSTPAKLLDQSELSTKAVFGDESGYLQSKTLGLESSFTTEDGSGNLISAEDSSSNLISAEDVSDFQPQLNKPTDPMSMSFYQDENETNPFDLNKVQLLPDDEEFAEKPEGDNSFCDTISDLPEHHPLGNESVEEVTDLDKPADSQELLCGVSQLPKTPEPTEPAEVESEAPICDIQPAKSPILIEASKAPLPISPEPNSEEQLSTSAPKTPDVISPLPQENALLDAEDTSSSIGRTTPKSPLLQAEEDQIVDTLGEQRISPLPQESELLDSELLCDETLNIQEPKSPAAITPEPTQELLCQSKSPEPVPTTTLEGNLEKVEEFFPIFQKPPVQQEESAEKPKESALFDGFFPNFSKPAMGDFGAKSDSPEPCVDDVPELESSKSPAPVIDDALEKLVAGDALSRSPIPVADEVVKVEESSKSPLPLSDAEIESKSPVPTLDEVQARTPEPVVEVSEQIASKTPEPAIGEVLEQTPSKTPEPAIDAQIETSAEPETQSREAETLSVTTPEPEVLDVLQPKLPEVEPCDLPVSEEDLLPKPSESVPEFELPETVETHLDTLSNEVQMILDGAEHGIPTESEAKSPETIEESLDSEKRDLESPLEDITSSVKDDNSLSPEIIEEAKDIGTEKEVVKDSFICPTAEPLLEAVDTNYAQELSNAIQESSETVLEKEPICVEVSSTPNTTFSEQAESVNTADVNSFLERSNNMPDVTSPLSPDESFTQHLEEARKEFSNELVGTISDVVTTTSSEVKVETPPVEEKEAPAALPEVAVEAESKESTADETIIAAAVGVTAAAVTAAAVTAAVKDKKPAGKATIKSTALAKKPPKSTQSPTKTPAPKSTTKPAASARSAPLSSPTKPAAASKPPAKSSSVPKTTATTKPPATKPSPRPKFDNTITKSIEKKPVMNGDAKAPAKSPLTAKRPSTTTSAAKVPLTSKASPAKTETKPSAIATKISATSTNVSSMSSTVTKTTSATTTARSATPRTRPTSLTSKTTGSLGTAKTSTVPATKSTVQSRVGTTASSLKTTTAKPKPPTNLTSKSPTVGAAPKPKPSATRTSLGKGVDNEKQIKDSVNKQLTASSRTTSSKTTGTLTAGRTTTTTTVKKTEIKSPSTRTTATTKTTITSIKSTNKKPAEITRITAKKAVPTKTTTAIKAAQENGLTNGVTTTTIVQETTTILSTEPQLIKDLSPIENKLLVDNSQLSETNVAD